MNNIYKIDFNYKNYRNTGGMGSATLPKNAVATADAMERILRNLEDCFKEYSSDGWQNNGALIDVKYIRIIAKSRRIGKILHSSNKDGINGDVVGAKYSEDNKHIITYYIQKEDLTKSIINLKECIEIVSTIFKGRITEKNIIDINANRYVNIFRKININKTTFTRIVVDSYFIETIAPTKYPIIQNSDTAIVSIYKTGQIIKDLLIQIGISIPEQNILDDYTAILYKEDRIKFEKSFPHLISSEVKDALEIQPIQSYDNVDGGYSIDPPNNEPTIGVIDTLFNANVYTSEWVESHNELPKGYVATEEDTLHGTAVSSIIVDGPTMNPDMQDNCGHFRVRHFGVMGHSGTQASDMARKIQKIVEQNSDIHVWNLSLGSNNEIDNNRMSYIASVIDKLQYERKNIIFVIAATNLPKGEKPPKKIGSPADSINSLVVGSVKKNGKPASYSRDGIVLSFYNKPDISYYGSDDKEKMYSCKNAIEGRLVQGTSFAAPWIARKLCFLIDIMGFDRETAKALIVDSAIKWKGNVATEDRIKCGYGIVPIDIKEILRSNNDEIKIITSYEIKQFETKVDNIPVPIIDNRYPYIAKATACYFPSCDIKYGVDYTDTELDFKFGRIKNNGNVDSINDDRQYNEDTYTYEKEARDLFRKWDNVKHIVQLFTNRLKPKNRLSNLQWGIDIKASTRNNKVLEPIRVGIVITLKELSGKNRINSFIRSCELQGLNVTPIDIDIMMQVSQQLEEEIELE